MREHGIKPHYVLASYTVASVIGPYRVERIQENSVFDYSRIASWHKGAVAGVGAPQCVLVPNGWRSGAVPASLLLPILILVFITTSNKWKWLSSLWKACSKSRLFGTVYTLVSLCTQHIHRFDFLYHCLDEAFYFTPAVNVRGSFTHLAKSSGRLFRGPCPVIPVVCGSDDGKAKYTTWK